MMRETNVHKLCVAGSLVLVGMAAGCSDVPGVNEALLRSGIFAPSFFGGASGIDRVNEDFILAVSTGANGFTGFNRTGTNVPVVTTPFGPTFNRGLEFGPAVNDTFGMGFNTVGFGRPFNTDLAAFSVGFTNPEFSAGFTRGFNTPGFPAFASTSSFPIFSNLNVGMNDPFFNTPGGVPVAGLSNSGFASTNSLSTSVSGF